MNPEPNPRESSPDLTTPARRAELDGLIVAIKALVEQVKLGNGLAAEASARLRRHAVVQGIAVGVFVVAFGLLLSHACVQAGRLSDVTAQLDETTRLLEQVRAQGAATQQKVEDVKEDVAVAAAAAPVVEIRQADAGAGRKPGKPTAVVIVRPSTKTDAGAPAITLPIELPSGSVVEDAGAPKQ